MSLTTGKKLPDDHRDSQFVIRESKESSRYMSELEIIDCCSQQ